MKKYGTLRVLPILLAVCLLLPMMLSGCGGSPASSQEPAASQGAAPAQGSANDNSANENPEDLRTVTFGLQTSTNSLPFYVAQQEGFFAKEGIDAEFLVYTSGGAQIEAAASDAWMFGTGGVFPAITGMLNMDLRVVGSCMSDDSMVDLWVRPDSPIAQSGAGHSQEFPTLYGTAEDWKGVTVLGPVNTTGHYCLVLALDALGLTLDDVTITNMEVNSANTAFKAGEGDVLISWLALSVDAANEGWVKAAVMSEVGSDTPSMIYATAAACEDPELVEKVLKVYYETTLWMAENQDKTVQHYQDLLYDNGVTATEEECRAVVETIPYHTLEQSQHYMQADANGERYMMQCFANIMEYLISQGTYTEEDLARVRELDLMPDTYINAVKLDQ